MMHTLDTLIKYDVFKTVTAESLDVDFFAISFTDGMCSCCHDVFDLPDDSWRLGKSRKSSDNPTWILFNNADNLVGEVTTEMYINDYTFIKYSENLQNTLQLQNFIVLLEEVLNENYKIDVEATGISIEFVERADRLYRDNLYLEVKEYNEQFRKGLKTAYFT
ncbi:hypothetical protein [Erysipelothrix anatis]|uniref:hypothetical protein n=1 Tax=Erysipelothrix anatis TaxID=2683713 RepID=UPI00135AB6A7|nr:hypothetical protein [Erysipelothrix anatis]